MAEKKNWGYEGQGKSFDSELNRKVLFGFLISLALLVIVTAALMRGVFGFLVSDVEKNDPAPSPIAAANLRRLPPEPRLEVDPTVGLRELHAHEDSILMSYGWENEAEGIARVPVERAMEMIAHDGPPSWTYEEPSAPGGGNTSGEMGSSR